VRAAGFAPNILHLAQTAGSRQPASRHATTLRVGIGLYGLTLPGLQPALRVISTITKVVELEKGQSVSYGRTFVAPRPMRLGIIPFGYYEGLPRELSNRGQVGFGKELLPIAGRICMNHAMIDLGDTAAQVGDEVVVISDDPTSPLCIEQLEKEFGLFSYQLLVGINQNLRRVIV
jgi:alanine racemase